VSKFFPELLLETERVLSNPGVK